MHQVSIWFFSFQQQKLTFFLLLLVFCWIGGGTVRAADRWDGIVITQANYDGLQALKQGLIDPGGFLRSWNETGLGACSGEWLGIKCVNGQVIAIQLPWRGLGGHISEKIGQLTSLRKINFHDNSIGGQIPPAIGFLPNLRGLYLFNNRFSGSIPPEISNCRVLQTIDLSGNMLTSEIPVSISNSSRLYRLNLSFNNLTGEIPIGITRSSSLNFLSLNNNNISGKIPDTWGAHQLQILNLDRNSLSGHLPISLSKLPRLKVITAGDNRIDGSIPGELGDISALQQLDLSGNDIGGNFPVSLCKLSTLVLLDLEGNRMEGGVPPAIDGMKNLTVLALKGNRFNGSIPVSIGNLSSLSTLDLSENNFTGEIPDSLVGLSNLNAFNVSDNQLFGPVPLALAEKFNTSSFRGNLQLCWFNSSVPCSSPPSNNNLPPTATISDGKLTTKEKILIVAGCVLVFLLFLCCVLLFFLSRQRSSTSSSSAKKGLTTTTVVSAVEKKSIPEVVESGGEAGGKLVHFDGPMVFTADDLLCATAEIMGKSTYGTVYKATLENRNQVAVKRLREKISKGQKEFEAEVNLIGKIRHPNLLPLRAYYFGPKGEKLLVFDYMPKGNLSAFLHARGPDTLIDWPTRMKIAMGTTRGLLHLHTGHDTIHGNMTSSNILLDEDESPKIADFGLSRLMTASASANVIATAGALGYRAPELSKLKKANTKTDVYSLGVVILELLTGKSPGEAMNGVDLPQWVASIVKEEWTNEVFDLELMKDADSGDELLNTLKLALHCVDPSPAARPEVQQVLRQLEEIMPNLAGTSNGGGSESAKAEGSVEEAPTDGEKRKRP